jgi:formamidopyrimidine-DNA glycosylase
VLTTEQSYFFVTPPALLKRKLMHRRITGLERVGKYLLASLDDGARLLLHLGMTGQLFSADAVSPRLLSAKRKTTLNAEAQSRFTPDEHTHLCFQFEDGGPNVMFRDVRKFGKCAYLKPGEKHPRLSKLGRDTLRANGEVLFEAARKRTIPIKTLLLDQQVLAGVGNIYADEALHLARVHPERRADRVSATECEAIVSALKRVMLRSIETGGSSISDYVQPDGSDGGYQEERRVYAREGAPCFNCARPIQRVVIGQRSSHFCSKCQR